MNYWKEFLFLFFLLTGSVLSADSVTEHVAVVSSKAFHRPLETWIKHRTDQGYTVHLIVEPFGKETTTPEQIKDRLKQLSEQVPLSAVLLVGRAVENQVPSPLVPCRIIQRFGKEPQLATDDWYADCDNNGLADCPVGRFPASTPQELDEMIQKTIRYETQTPPGAWCRQLQLVAGLGNISPMIDGVIETMTRHILAEAVPGSWDISLLHTDWQSSFCPSPLDFQNEMLRTLHTGSLFWVYLGHGNPQRLDPINTPLGWLPTYEAGTSEARTSRGLCPRNTGDTVPGSLSIAMLFCCYGGFLDRETPSIAEEWMCQPDGPVAAIAASRTAMPYGMGVFGIEMLQELVRCQNEMPPKTLTLGMLVYAGKQRMFDAPIKKKTNRRSVREMLDSFAKMLDPAPTQLNVQREEHAAMFHLFGDPLLRLPIPKTIKMQPSIKVKPEDVLHLEGSLNQSGTVEIELLPSPVQITLHSPFREEFRYDTESRKANYAEYLHSNQRVLFRCTAELRDGKFSVAIPIPRELSGDYVVRTFWSSKTDYALGSSKITVLK